MARSRMSCSTRRPVLSAAVATACACAAFALFPKEAHAAHFDLGIDGDANALLAPDPGKNNLSTLGTGFKLRFGDQFALRYGMHITPEIGYAFDHIFASTSGNPENMNRIFVGGRLGFGRFVIPTIYAHMGLGFRSIGTSNNTAATIPGADGFTIDTGVALDFKLAPHLMLGPHAEYVFVDAPSTYLGVTSAGPQWIAFGAHLDIIF